MENAKIVGLTRGVIVLSIALAGTTRIATAQTETRTYETETREVQPAETQETRSYERRTYATRGPDSPARYTSSELAAGQWRSGADGGVLFNTPDDAAIAMNGHADYFIANNVSVGPLAQVAFTGDMFQFGLSGQGKYWIPLQGTNGRGKVALQSGVGFIHSDSGPSDTSWLVPIGIGYEHALNSGMDLTATTLINFTNLHNSGGADVMPGVSVGLKF